MTIGVRLTHALEMRGMTQSELAEKTGITEVSISRYINDLRTPRVSQVIALCKELNISADWLLGLKGE